MDANSKGNKVLVTGAGGAVGQPVCAELVRRGHQVRGFDRQDAPPAEWAGHEWQVGDLAERDAVRQAVAGMDAVVHLAAIPDDAPFIEQLLQPNVVGLFHVMDAAREEGVRRVVVASSIQVIDGLRTKMGPLNRPIQESDGAAPTNHYALTKAWAEQMGEMYAGTYGMSVLAVRIGWVPRDAESVAAMDSSKPGATEAYLSWDDAGRFFAAAVEAQGIDYAVLFALGPGDGAHHYSREAARQLIGYEGRDHWPDGMPFSRSVDGAKRQAP